VRAQRTFEAIVALLKDGCWHALDDLRSATQFPHQWVEELRAEGLLDIEQTGGSVLVRLKTSTG